VSKQHRSFLLASLLPALLLGGLFAVVHAKDEKSPAAKQTRWSDPATWPDRKVPKAGDKVTVKGSHARDMTQNAAAAREIVTADGRSFIVGPAGEEGSGGY